MPSESLLRRLTTIPGMRTLWSRYPVGSLETRVRFGISDRPHYSYGVYTAADLAKKLGLKAVSVFEFGVAGGRGLVAMENIAAEVSRTLGIEVAVYGFDAGSGMPTPLDYRDLPHVWAQGFYRMDEAALRAKLKTAKLVVGDVAVTVPEFVRKAEHPPVGFVGFDLDYYSSTKAAFQLFEGATESHLPRVICYLDDIIWPEAAFHNQWVGELCAVREFNEEHDHMKIAPIHQFTHTRPNPAAWHEQMYVLHDFKHPGYCVNLTPKGDAHTQKPL